MSQKTYTQKMEKRCRSQFETWAKQGTRQFMYPLEQTASGEYVSPFAEYAWRAFKAGWRDGVKFDPSSLYA